MEDFAPQEYMEHMRTYLSGLDEDLKVEKEVYRERLSLCTDCDDLMEGLCRKCGCFVEYRAALKNKHCPGSPSRW